MLVSVKMTGIKKFKSPGYFLATEILDLRFAVLFSEYIDDWAALFELLMCDSVPPSARKYNERRLEWGAHPRSARAVRYWDIFRKLEQLDSTSIRGMAAWTRVSIERA